MHCTEQQRLQTPFSPIAAVLFCWRHVFAAFTHRVLIRSWEEKRKARKPVWSEGTCRALRNVWDSPCNSLAEVSVGTQPPCAARFWWWTRHRWSGRRASRWRRGWTARSGAPYRSSTVSEGRNIDLYYVLLETQAQFDFKIHINRKD